MRRPLILLAVACAVAFGIALTALSGGRLTSYTGAAEAAATEPSRWWTLWAVPPLEVAAVALVALTVVGAVHRRGRRMTPARVAYLSTGVAILLVAVCSPLAGLAQGGVLAAHMLQHTLIGAFAPLPLLLAVPRAEPDAPRPGGVLGVVWHLAHPVAAFTLWAVSTVLFLLPDIHHAVLVHQSLWVLQQVVFLAVGLLLWMPVLDRWRQSPAWFGTGIKSLYMTGVFFVGLLIANVYWFSGTAFYASHAVAADVWGLDPLQDQANAGTVMMVTHCLLALGATSVLFFRQAREDGIAQRLRESGVDPARVRSALDRGELDELAQASGVTLRSRPGID